MASIAPTFVFCPPLLGKPDPNAERVPFGKKDNRKRIAQSKQKGPHCWLYAFNLFRHRFKAPNTRHLFERRVEQAASQRRRELKKVELKRICLSRLPKGQMEMIQGITKETSIEKVETKSVFSSYSWFQDYIVPYLSSGTNDHFYDYLIAQLSLEENEANERFFSRIGGTLAEAFKNQNQRKFKPNNFNKLPIKRKLIVGQWLVRKEFAEKVHLVPANWSPADSFEALVKELQTFGPLCVTGFFGQGYYTKPPRLAREIQGRQIFGWNPRDQDLKKAIGHAVVLVGAEAVGNHRLVYFIDPLDPSDPQKPKDQKIYAMTYQNLTSFEMMLSHEGIGFSRKKKWTPGFTYAYRNAILEKAE